MAESILPQPVPSCVVDALTGLYNDVTISTCYIAKLADLMIPAASATSGDVHTVEALAEAITLMAQNVEKKMEERIDAARGAPLFKMFADDKAARRSGSVDNEAKGA